jgi:hypothetical protein
MSQGGPAEHILAAFLNNLAVRIPDPGMKAERAARSQLDSSAWSAGNCSAAPRHDTAAGIEDSAHHDMAAGIVAAAVAAAQTDRDSAGTEAAPSSCVARAARGGWRAAPPPGARTGTTPE